MRDEARALLEQFRRMIDPASDPEAAIRDKLKVFMRAWLDAKGSEGGHVNEGKRLLIEAAERDPRHWHASPDRLRLLWSEIFDGPERLPPLSPPAQLVWLGLERRHPNEIIDQALFRQFPRLTPDDRVAAYRESTAYSKKEAMQAAMEAGVLNAWAEVHRARGRAESELIFGTCVEELGLIEERGGGQYLNFNNLRHVADPELRHATLAAAWKAAERSALRRDAARRLGERLTPRDA
jgi:hypothetical protein